MNQADQSSVSARSRGIASTIATQLGVTATCVRKVRAGKAVSARITSALASLALNACDQTQLRGLTPEELRELQYGGKYYGLFSRTAKACGVSRNAVADAARGRTKSQFILAHLHAEMEATRPSPPHILDVLTTEQREAFRPGGRYYGSVTRVARRLRTTPGNVSLTLNGRRSVPHILRALRMEMSRIDGSIAAQTRFANRGGVQ